ncbi:MAG: arginase family protein [Bacteroidales bacterium]
MNFADYLNNSEAVPHSMGLPKQASIYGKVSKPVNPSNITIDDNTLVIIGVNESRNSANIGSSKSADAIRRYLYSLSGASISFNLIDLGNIKDTSSPADTYGALREVVAYVNSKGGKCLVLGGTQELTWPVYQGITENSSNLNVSFIDYTIDKGTNDGDFSASCYIDRFLAEPQQNLFSLNILGYQGYLTNSNHISSLQSLNCELSRLGQARSAMTEVEPTLRDSDIVSFDIASVRQGDSPGAAFASPNGFYAEEACQIARYAGLSPRVKAFGLFELNTHNDTNGQSAHLAAQLLWHYMDAFSARTKYILQPNNPSIKKFYIKSPIPNVNLVFLHNISNDTWWMEIIHPTNEGKEHVFIACSYNDYRMASNGDVPDRWMRVWKKMT